MPTPPPECRAAQDARHESIRRTIHTFMHTDRLHRAAIERALAGLGLHRTQHRVLHYLAHHGGAGPQRAIAEEFEVSPAAVAVTLRKLEGAGYLCRRTAEADGRCKEVALTEAGKDILAKSYDAFTAVDLSMFASLTEEELSLFSSLLLRMQEGLRREEGRGGDE
jgi:DNA-binding MarR family transcriptional regulator